MDAAVRVGRRVPPRRSITARRPFVSFIAAALSVLEPDFAVASENFRASGELPSALNDNDHAGWCGSSRW